MKNKRSTIGGRPDVIHRLRKLKFQWAYLATSPLCGSSTRHGRRRSICVIGDVDCARIWRETDTVVCAAHSFSRPAFFSHTKPVARQRAKMMGWFREHMTKPATTMPPVTFHAEYCLWWCCLHSSIGACTPNEITGIARPILRARIKLCMCVHTS